MRKVLFCVLLSFMLTSLFSCTENIRTTTFGGKMKIELPKGQKLIMATWKKNNLFYLTEPMDENYNPKNKVFQESSSYGIMEGQVTFIESK